jgi:oligosaccharide repeat unit polymerase
MRLVYLVLLVTLLITYGSALWRILKYSSGLSPLLGWWVGLGYFLICPLTMITIAGGFEMPGAYEVGSSWKAVELRSGSFFLPYFLIWLCFQAACLVIYLFGPSRSSNRHSPPVFSIANLERAILTTMGLTVLDWLIMIKLLGGLDAFIVSHWYERGEDLVSRLGDSFVLLEHLSMANQVVFTSAAALYMWLGLSKRPVKKKILAVTLLFLVLEMVMTGNRIYLATYLMAFLVSCFIWRRKRLLVALLVASPVLVLVFSVWAAIRHDLTQIPDSLNNYVEADFGNRTSSALFDITEGMDLLLLMHVIRDFGSKYDYLYGASYSRSVLSFIPRSIYPEKPETFTGSLAELYLPNILTSLNATAIGEMYANFGAATLFLFPFSTFCVIWISNWANGRDGIHFLGSPILFSLMVWTARSTFEDSFVLFLLALCLIYIFRLERKTRSRQHERFSGIAARQEKFLPGTTPLPS